MLLKGKFKVEHVRDGEVLNTIEGLNGITNGGYDALLDIMFHADTQIDPWYIRLIDNAGFSALAAADTMASHAGWVELSEFDETVRPEWTEGASSGQSITNSSAVVFNMNATKTVNGIFVCSDNTIDATAGTLWATGSFSSAQAVENGDQLRITYTVAKA